MRLNIGTFLGWRGDQETLGRVAAGRILPVGGTMLEGALPPSARRRPRPLGRGLVLAGFAAYLSGVLR